MSAQTQTDWAQHALATLQEAGHRRGGARTAVVEALAAHQCAVTALDLDDELARRSPRVARGVAGYERVDPTGHHHHHAICRDCGRMVPFEDKSLEKALAEVAGTMSFDVTEHDVVLRGRCDRCTR